MKKYIDLVNGQLVFADLLKVTDTLAPFVNISKTRDGIGIVRWGAKQLVNTRKMQPGCEDSCKSSPFVRKYDFSCTGDLPQTPEEVLLVKKELKQFFADLDLLVQSGAINGVKPSIALEFPIVP